MLKTLENKATKPPTKPQPRKPNYERKKSQQVAPVNENDDGIDGRKDRQPKNRNQSRKANDPCRDEDEHPPEERQ